MKQKKIISVLFLLLVIFASGLGIIFRQSIYDQYRLYNYQAPAAIAQLATDTTMNEDTRRVFYIQHPTLKDKKVFRSRCSIYEQTIVLGCYSMKNGIFILKVDDARLQGVEQVTAAHELLHAEYDRLSSAEKQRINSLLQSTYNSLTDEGIKKNVEAYKTQDPAVVNNELHSILGTELKNLPPELETYYKRYFNDRAKIVDYANNYEAAFKEIKSNVDNYGRQLSELKIQIDQLKSDLDHQTQALEQERSQLDKLIEQERYQEYNTGVEPFNQNIGRYNAKIIQTQQLIERYNRIVEEQKALVLEARELYEAIDTRVAPQLKQQ